MSPQILQLREGFGRLLCWLIWAHVPLLAFAGWTTTGAALPAALAGTLLAMIYHASWLLYGHAAVTRNLSAIIMMCLPAILLMLFARKPWQMDMHMYFFAMMALSIGWFDRATIVLSAIATSLHHLILLYVLPLAVFPGEGNLARVLLHAAIVAFQAAVLIWVSGKVLQAFERIHRMSEEIVATSVALKERTLEAEESTRVKSIFLANVSHEIRTPINAILGFSHILQRAPLTPEQMNQVRKIHGAGSTLLRLINDLLDFSKNEAGKLILERREFDLVEAIDNQIALVRDSAEERGLGIEVNYLTNVPDRLSGDQMRFDQVLLNLLSNAVKFGRTGTIVVTVRCDEWTDDTVSVQIAVRDNGIGMSAEEQSRLFTAFSQADSSTTRQYGGTGLGLAISRQIVEQMGGWIRVESIADLGSVFTFMIPFERVDTGASAPMRDKAAMPGRPASKNEIVHVIDPRFRDLCVLLVDDNEINREIGVGLLGNAGLLVECAANGRVACDMVGHSGQRYAAILMDVQMPEMDGIDATTEIRKVWSADQLPIIALTAHTFDEERRRCLAAGMNDHIAKPIDPKLLIARLNHWFQRGARKTIPQPMSHNVVPLAGDDAFVTLPADLAPFDLGLALDRTNGNPALLRRLIASFAQTYASAPSDLSRLISAGELAEASRLAHSLKGVAATLTLSSVADVAALLERAATSDETGETDNLIAALAEALDPALAAAQTLEPTVRTINTSQGAGGVRGEQDAVDLARDALVRVLRRRSLTAEQAFDAYAHALGLDAQARQDHPALQAIASRDFDLALEALNLSHPGTFPKRRDKSA
ncbi:ATP-binding protein [Paracoccus sp. TK19116]|uniref:histidine kinase n=1 Tax=Paracoccus albicereus TaxID=2922394 RepID=A0ABT1MPG3_9RHOB|nr:ATP-binding protein [Paracoccus albicereus]MCQ0970187.1 ATP-binding protein [Paracoccus albicereus]